MKNLKLTYFTPTDILYIVYNSKGEKSEIGDIEFQDNVTLFRDETSNEVNAVEILNFRDFKENYIRVSSTEVKDMAHPFRILRMFISLEDIWGTNEYDQTLEEWGFKKIRKKNKENTELNLAFSNDTILTRKISEIESMGVC